MTFPRLLVLLPLLFSPCLADTAEAAALLRSGKAEEALRATEKDSGPAADFWRGRALVELHRLQEAIPYLSGVPEDSPLYPYAAKALLYCAWQCPEVDFELCITPLTVCGREDIADLATTALAEYWLRRPGSVNNSALELLRNRALRKQELQPVLELLEVKSLRGKGQIREAEQLCRRLEQNRELPSDIRQRACLELAELYYDKEAGEAADEEPAGATAGFSVLPTAKADEDEGLKSTNARGTGEETLLQFINVHPESPLLEEAVRRLSAHHAFETDTYARKELETWSADTRYPRRAATAQFLLQQLHLRKEGAEERSAAMVNNAMALFPKERASHLMALEHARCLLEHGKTQEAELYLNLVPEESPYLNYLRTRLLPQNSSETARAYQEAVRGASADLRRAARSHALLCALRAGDAEEVNHILQAAEDDRTSLSSLCLAYHLRQGNHSAAGETMNSMQGNEADIDVQQDNLLLHLLRRNVSGAYETLAAMPEPETAAQRERLFILMEFYCDVAGISENEKLETLRHIAGNSPELTLQLSERYADAGRQTEALACAEKLLNTTSTPPELIPRALYRAARANECLSTPQTLKKAVSLYEHCAAVAPELHRHALIRQASVLTRIGRTEEAIRLLTAPEENEVTLPHTAADEVLHGMVLSAAYAVRGGAGDWDRALEAPATLLAKRDSMDRRLQCALLLHHAALCTRAGKAREALDDYNAVLALKSPAPDAREWNELFSAAGGAVTMCEALGLYEEAAQWADTAAEWDKEKHPERGARFAEWAAYLRQTHFLKQKGGQ